MGAGDAHVVELAAVAGHGRDAALFRLGGNVREVCALGEEDLVHRAARAQGFEDGVAALDQGTVVLLRGTALVFFVCHKSIHSMHLMQIILRQGKYSTEAGHFSTSKRRK